MFQRKIPYSMVIAAVALLSTLVVHAADGPPAPSSTKAAPTLEEKLTEEFGRDPTAYVDHATGAFTLTGAVIFDPRAFADEDLAALRALIETGEWAAPSGRLYDLRHARLHFRDGAGGLGDLLANLASMPRRGWRASPPPKSSAAYREGMTASQYLEAAIRNLGPRGYHLDGATGAFVVPRLSLQLVDRPGSFVVEVLELALAKAPWTADSGAVYDLRQTIVTFATSASGAPQADRRRLTDEFYALLKNVPPVNDARTTFISTMNPVAQGELPPALLERMTRSIVMKPFGACAGDLIKPNPETTD